MHTSGARVARIVPVGERTRRIRNCHVTPRVENVIPARMEMPVIGPLVTGPSASASPAQSPRGHVDRNCILPSPDRRLAHLRLRSDGGSQGVASVCAAVRDPALAREKILAACAYARLSHSATAMLPGVRAEVQPRIFLFQASAALPNADARTGSTCPTVLSAPRAPISPPRADWPSPGRPPPSGSLPTPPSPPPPPPCVRRARPAGHGAQSRHVRASPRVSDPGIIALSDLVHRIVPLHSTPHFISYHMFHRPPRRGCFPLRFVLPDKSPDTRPLSNPIASLCDLDARDSTGPSVRLTSSARPAALAFRPRHTGRLR
ncbi:hypothetical protein WOLCODRAFT_150230 [Wolfiporia cocos MD-104 SS10]|uniref:Uncharacterized protein n=1 Tax=Wolfiporia cocos (strain MD-104) TaxID=742152 RepID=A0A2H3JD67_WOLCO|nr:hypothetical protein WOLCODRAFT_150230 [Wolfiporia cocos MD-104 SS10]